MRLRATEKLALPTVSVGKGYEASGRGGIGFAKRPVWKHMPTMTPSSILLVDDDVELLKALTKVLEKQGYAVVAQPDANSALRYLQENRPKFDLVITDVSMPGMKGTTFLSALRTAYPKLPVVLITAFGDWGQYAEAIRDGAFEYLSKPLDRMELLAVVRRALAPGAAGGPLPNQQTVT